MVSEKNKKIYFHNFHFSVVERGAGFSAITQNPEFMAAIGKSFTSQTATLSRMVEERDDNGIFRNEKKIRYHYIWMRY